MDIAVDGTPLIGRTTGVGTYTRGLVSGLVESGLRPRLVPFTWRAGSRPDGLPDPVRWRHRPAPARLLQASWARWPVPPVEWFAGRVDVFHATNFVLPPTWRAGSIVTVHDLTYLHHPEWVTPPVLRYRELVPRSLRGGDTVVVTPSRAVADEVLDAYGLPSDRVVATPLGVDPAWTAASAPPPSWLAARGLPTGYTLFAGTQEPRKNLGMLLSAHRAARAAGAAPLVLAGPSGWGADEQLHDGVHVAGWLPAAELRSLVAGAEALLLPSHYEGFGLPLLEAMAARTPVVASDIPAHREVAGGHAVLLPPHDVAAWTAHLSAPARPDDDQLARASSWALGHTWTACAEATLQAYERARP